MIKICVFFLLSGPFALHGMDRVANAVEGVRALPVADGAHTKPVLRADVLEAQKAEIRKKLPSIREGLLDLLACTDLTKISVRYFDKEALAVVIAEELFGDQLFTHAVLAWVNEYSMQVKPTARKKRMADNVRQLLHFAKEGAYNYKVPLEIDQIGRAYERLYLIMMGEILENEAKGIDDQYQFGALLDYDSMGELFDEIEKRKNKKK